MTLTTTRPTTTEPSRRRAVLPLLALSLIGSCLLAISVGAYTVPVTDVVGALWRGASADPGSVADAVILDIRAPRVALGVIVGACLAVAGVIMQGIFANPLAEPGLVGVSSGAAVGAVLAIVVGATTMVWMLPLSALAGGLAVTAGVYLLARVDGRAEVLTLILTGVAVNAFAGAVIGLLMSVSDDAQLRSITFWNLGSLSAATWTSVALVLPFAAVGLVTAPRLARSLDLLALGERTASHLGVDLESVRRLAIVLTAVLTAAAVAVAGIVGFVGLVVPHAMRLLIGPGHRLLIPAAAMAGATLLTLADLLARVVVAPREIPLGVLTALIGSPVFFWLLRREHRRRGAWA
ncbi:MAG: iron ABC transporter permease [Candidatus Nanopelagicales bacterium]